MLINSLSIGSKIFETIHNVGINLEIPQECSYLRITVYRDPSGLKLATDLLQVSDICKMTF